MQILRMAIISWIMAASISHATPEKYASGIVALDAFLRCHASEARKVVGMTGFYGQDQPRQWLVLTTTPEGILEEFAITEGEVEGVRQLPRLPGQDLPDIEIDPDRLKIDSDTIFEMAESLARQREIGYDSVHYQLRCRELNREPVWMVNLLDPIGKSIGVHYISAESGIIMRSSWNLKKQTSERPASLLYGGKIQELELSGKAPGKRRVITRPIKPKSAAR